MKTSEPIVDKNYSTLNESDLVWQPVLRSELHLVQTSTTPEIENLQTIEW